VSIRGIIEGRRGNVNWVEGLEFRVERREGDCELRVGKGRAHREPSNWAADAKWGLTLGVARSNVGQPDRDHERQDDI
jgi:hypothetical protein